jgi:hypothetical protein
MGLALLVQVLLAPPVYFVWLRPVTAPDFLANAAGSAFQIRAALLLAFVPGVMTLGIAIAALPVFRRHSERFAFAYLALSTVGLATLAMETLATRNLLLLSQEYANAGAAAELLQTLGHMARSTWISVHCTNLVVAHGTVFVLYLILFRHALVPRALAGFGMAASLLSTTVVAMPLLGYGFSFRLIMPTALSALVLIVWLLARGLSEGKHPPGAEADRPEFARA